MLQTKGTTAYPHLSANRVTEDCAMPLFAARASYLHRDKVCVWSMIKPLENSVTALIIRPADIIKAINDMDNSRLSVRYSVKKNQEYHPDN